MKECCQCWLSCRFSLELSILGAPFPVSSISSYHVPFSGPRLVFQMTLETFRVETKSQGFGHGQQLFCIAVIEVLNKSRLSDLNRLT